MAGTELRVLDGSAFVLSDAKGDLGAGDGGLHGFFWQDTRFLSRWVLRADGGPLDLLSVADADYFAGQVFLVPPARSIYENPQLSIMRRRLVRGTWLEDLLVVNHRDEPVEVALRLDADADFADLFEVKDDDVPARPVERRADRGGLLLRYERDGFLRETVIACDAPEAHCDEQGLSIAVRLGPHEQRLVSLRIEPHGEQAGRRSSPRAAAGGQDEVLEAMHGDLDAWLERAPRLETDWDALAHAYRRSLIDLAALRFRPWPERAEAVPAAGMPWFMTLFGRDSLITSFQAVPFLPELAAATLRVLAEHQGRDLDDRCDEEPGKILHELRFGELTATGKVPFGPYYGTADATPLFVVLLDELHRWSGDDGLVLELEPAARAALDWLGTSADLLGDGYVRYQQRAPGGLLNQCWKDSHNSMLFADGTLAEGPMACCEIQGYAYDARRRGARLAREVWRDEALAARLEAEAEDLRRRFHDDFWMPERGAYALALDGEGRRVDSLTSNIGHLLWSGIVAPGTGERLAGHLLGEELFSGWGVRTMGACERGYNPVEYHDGTVWPHDSGIAAFGLARRGFRHEATAIADALLCASARFEHRLPEVFAGYPRALTRFPVQYPTASSPQAWAAGTPLLLLRVLLGLEPGAGGPSCDACLPEHVGRLVLRGIPGAWGRADVDADAGERIRTVPHGPRS